MICCTSLLLNRAAQKYRKKKKSAWSSFGDGKPSGTSPLANCSKFLPIIPAPKTSSDSGGSGPLHQGHVKLEEYQYMILHHPGQAYNHTDGLSCLSEAIQLTSLDLAVLQVLCHVLPPSGASTKFTATDEDRILLGKSWSNTPCTPCTKHVTSACTRCTASSENNFISSMSSHLTQEVTGQCHLCLVDKDYPVCNTNVGLIENNFLWHILVIFIMGPFPASHGHHSVISFTD